MFAVPRRTILALARSCLQPNRTVSSVSSVHPLRPFRSPLSWPQLGRRQFTTSSPSRVQYTRFSNGYSYPSYHPDRDKVKKILVFVTAAGAVYYVAQYVDQLTRSRSFIDSSPHSLEQVPETGRWRFMDISPRFEATLEKTSYTSLLSEFEDRILPANHPITRHVHRVVSQLLEASDLGMLQSSSTSKPSADDDGFWHDDPFAAARPHDSSPAGGGKEWHLLVVNDPKIVNALASFGMCLKNSYDTPLNDSPGTIVVFTGILPVCKDEQGLAAVVGHGT